MLFSTILVRRGGGQLTRISLIAFVKNSVSAKLSVSKTNWHLSKDFLLHGIFFLNNELFSIVLAILGAYISSICGVINEAHEIDGYAHIRKLDPNFRLVDGFNLVIVFCSLIFVNKSFCGFPPNYEPTYIPYFSKIWKKGQSKGLLFFLKMLFFNHCFFFIQLWMVSIQFWFGKNNNYFPSSFGWFSFS